MTHANPTKLADNKQKKGWNDDAGGCHQLRNTSKIALKEKFNTWIVSLHNYFHTRPQQSEQVRDTDGTESGSTSHRSDGESDENEQA